MPSSPVDPVSVVIPAHNEEAVIGRCLDRLLKGSEEGELDIVVVCNGCRDRTAEVAKRHAPGATVIELPVASKVAALNAGDQCARYFPRFYVDADVELPIASLRLTARALAQPGVLCAAPRPVWELEGRTWAVKAFYRTWDRTPYITEDMVGTGVYALSEEGRRRFGAFPEIVNDDQFVALLFERGERRSVQGAHFVVHTPLTFAALVAIRTRAYRGNTQLAASGLCHAVPPRSGAGTVLRMAVHPRLAPAAAIYTAVNVLARSCARHNAATSWERDDTARSLAAQGSLSRRPSLREVGPEPAGQGRPAGAPVTVCYVTSHYPALSHTFVMREVLGLRAAGLAVGTVSVHRADPSHLLSELDKREAATTWNIFPLRIRPFLKDHYRAVKLAPRAYFTTLVRAVRAAPPGPARKLWQLFYFSEAIALWGHARRTSARHLHAHLANVATDICWLAASYAALAEPGQQLYWSFTMHGPTELYEAARYNLARKVANADVVFCISDFTRSQLMYLSAPADWHKLVVAHMGVDLERYAPTEPPQHQWFQILTVARLVPAKGLHLLLEALAVLARRGFDARAVFAGNGPLERELKDRAAELGLAERATFVGPIGQDKMATYYKEADVFCLPSFAEGVPVVLMEAMASGRPVVASQVAGVPELVEHGVSGLLVPPGNVGALADALEELAASPELRAKMGAAGRQRVEESFDANRCAKQVAEVFEALWSEAR